MGEKNQGVRGRFAPTPSVRMHLGNAFAALVAWLSARAAGGEMVLRIEDLDPRAANRERAEALIDDLCSPSQRELRMCQHKDAVMLFPPAALDGWGIGWEHHAQSRYHVS